MGRCLGLMQEKLRAKLEDMNASHRWSVEKGVPKEREVTMRREVCELEG
jgi:hypothetical protein